MVDGEIFEIRNCISQLPGLCSEKAIEINPVKNLATMAL
jgi:hypothetical protein